MPSKKVGKSPASAGGSRASQGSGVGGSCGGGEDPRGAAFVHGSKHLAQNHLQEKGWEDTSGCVALPPGPKVGGLGWGVVAGLEGVV